MRKILLAIALLISVSVSAQEWHPDWYVLEKGASVGILKPGINDLIYHIQVGKNSQINRAEIDKINAKLVFKAGHTLLIYAKSADNLYMATDVEGRTLIVQGKFTKAVYGSGCTPAYVKKAIKVGDDEIGMGAYVWVKKVDNATGMATVQGAGGTDVQVAVGSLYMVDETAATMMNEVKMKAVQ